MRALAIFFLLLCFSPMLFAQRSTPDTSFTTHSAYVKVLKTHPEAGIARVEAYPKVRSETDIVYADPDGRQLKLDIFYPAARRGKSLPAILMIHGGGWRSGSRSQQIPLAIALAERGYVSVCAEYRLSTEAIYPAAVIDLKAAVKWMRVNAVKYGIDGQKIAAMGSSAGGQLAALLGSTGDHALFKAEPAKVSDKVQAVIDIDGILAFIHPESGEGDDSKSRSAATWWFGASKTERPELWQQASPLIYAGKHTAPTLFLNSSVDRMHAGRDDMIRKMNSWNILSEVHTFTNAPHTFWLFYPWFAPTVELSDAFLKKVFN